jgi:hypothetical protein
MDQQVDCAYRAWSQVSDARAALMKRVQKIEKAIESADLGVEFELLYLEKRMVLVQYDALDKLYGDRFVEYNALVGKREIERTRESFADVFSRAAR